MEPKPGPNWLLRMLIMVSVGVHVLLLLHLSGIYRSNALSFIEMSLQNIRRPTPRDIPRPRPRPRPPEPRDRVEKLNVVHRPVPRLAPVPAASAEKTLAGTVVEDIGVPAIPRPPQVDTPDWGPLLREPEPVAQHMTAASYLEMVRLRIESRKRYPETAKAKGIEGRVKIHFILAADGSVRDLAVTQGAPESALNRAALEAVGQAAPFPRPPSNLFKTELALDLVIVFELT
jgi:protein TonB